MDIAGLFIGYLLLHQLDDLLLHHDIITQTA